MKWQPIETAPKDGTIIICKTASGFVSSARYWSADFTMDNLYLAGFVHSEDEYWGIADPNDPLDIFWDDSLVIHPIEWLDEQQNQ